MDERLVDFEANFSVLDRYGVDVTAETFITNPAIGRDQQIKELMLILLTPEKSAILIGKPGIGKTAIVEGLAYRMQRGEVPEALQGYTIINIKTASLLGTMPSGESKVQKMIDELKTREKVILFVDEVHMLIGATDSSSLDFANIFKEGLGRGSIKVIGATTTEEYERYILRDKAFTRRFQKVEVPEPTREETILIMMGTYPKFEKQTGRKLKYTRFIQERIMAFLVDITSEYKRVYALDSRYPDVCLTLLKQAFSYTVFDNREYVDIFDIRKAIENSKNIYPDVIKKELPRFDKEFNDIILEEKGEKPVEEWRREAGPTRYQQEANSIIVDTNANNQDNKKDGPTSIFKNLESAPTMVDRQTIKEYKPVKAILSEKSLKKFAKIGPTAISKGMKDKFSKKNDSRNIDNLLLSSEIGIISNKGDDSIKFNYTVGDELKPGGLNDLLLGKPISSTLDGLNPEPVVVKETYRSDNLFEKELDPNRNSLMLGNDSANASLNFRHSGSSTTKFLKADDFEDVLPNNHGSNRSERDNSRRRNDEFGLRNTGGIFEDNRRMYEEHDYRQNSKEREEVKHNDDNFGLGNINRMINDSQGMYEERNYRQEQSREREEVKHNDDNFGLGNINRMINDDRQSLYNNQNDFNNMGEPNLEKFENSLKMDSSSVEEENTLENFMNVDRRNGSFFGNKNSKDEFLFGAPMYSSEKEEPKVSSNNNYGVDIFGQLITDNMHIKGGKIMDGFSLENNGGRNQIIGDVVNVSNDNTENDLFHEKPVNNNDYRDYNSNSNSSSKKWNFLKDFEEEKEKPVPRFNELKIERPVSNNYVNDDVKKSNGFVNFNDLNSGKISGREVNQYISLSKPERVDRNIDFHEVKPQASSVDLTLKDIGEDEIYFDDFYES